MPRLAPVALGGLGAVAIAVGTARYGAGLTTDSAIYISTAQNLLAGNGYWTFQGHPMQHFAPLYPTLLALPGLVGLDPFAAARWIDVVCAALLNYVAAAWLFSHLRSRALALAASLAILCAFPLQDFAYSALSEPVFLLFVTLTLLDLDIFLRTGRHLGRAALCAGVAWLTRYAGLLLVAAGSIIVLMRPHVGSRRRLRDAAQFAIGGALPSLPWFLRNYRGSHVIGDRASAAATFGENAVQAIDSVSTWLVPARLPGPARALLFAGALGLVAWAAARRVPSQAADPTRAPADDPSLRVFLIFPLVYVALLVVATSRFAIDAPDHRYLAPIYPSLVFGVALIVDRAAATLPQRVRHGLALLIAVWLLYPVGHALARLHGCMVVGPGEFGTRPWRESALMGYVRQHRFRDWVFTNEPYAVFLLTGQALGESPTKRWYRSRESPQYPSQLDEELGAGRSAFLIWFQRSRRDDLFDLDELAARYRLEQIAALEDGAVFSVTSAGAPLRGFAPKVKTLHGLH